MEYVTRGINYKLLLFEIQLPISSCTYVILIKVLVDVLLLASSFGGNWSGI